MEFIPSLSFQQFLKSLPDRWSFIRFQPNRIFSDYYQKDINDYYRVTSTSIILNPFTRGVNLVKMQYLHHYTDIYQLVSKSGVQGLDPITSAIISGTLIAQGEKLDSLTERVISAWRLLDYKLARTSTDYQLLAKYLYLTVTLQVARSSFVNEPFCQSYRQRFDLNRSEDISYFEKEFMNLHNAWLKFLTTPSFVY